MSGKHLYQSESCSAYPSTAEQGHSQQQLCIQDMVRKTLCFQDSDLWHIYSDGAVNLVIPRGTDTQTVWTVLPELLNWIIVSHFVVPYCLFFMQTVYVSSWSRAIFGTAFIFFVMWPCPVNISSLRVCWLCALKHWLQLSEHAVCLSKCEECMDFWWPVGL